MAALVFGWGALSARLERFDVTAPIAFVVAGLLLTHGPLALLSVTPSKELINELAEFTLALVLFSDASRVGLHELRVDAGMYLRLLGAALPLTIGLGTLLALALDGSAGIWLALLVGAALAPTDAALGAGMMANPVVPVAASEGADWPIGRTLAAVGHRTPCGSGDRSSGWVDGACRARVRWSHGSPSGPGSALGVRASAGAWWPFAARPARRSSACRASKVTPPTAIPIPAPARTSRG